VIDVAKYGPWAVITGGSEGIGACLAEELANSGFNLVLIARKPGPLDAVAADVRARTGVQVRTLSLDLTDATMLERIREVTDDIDVGLLIYTAGSTHHTGPFVHWSLEDVLKVIRLNVEGPAVLAHHFGGKMAAHGRGGIVILGSLGGTAGSPTVIPYAGAKAFSQIFSEGLWWEMKQRGVDVLHVVVGAVNTPAMARIGIVYPEGGAVEAQEVAQHSLENIANGPVFVMPEMLEAFRQLARPDRRAATEMSASLIMATTDGTWSEPE
jgi:short-subunit dehydrogenase